jgi:hypothetical protein
MNVECVMWLIERRADSKRNGLRGARVEINRLGDIDKKIFEYQINPYADVRIDALKSMPGAYLD